MLKRLFALICILFNLYTHADLMMVDSHHPLADEDLVKDFFNKITQIIKEKTNNLNRIHENGYTYLNQALVNNAYVENKISQLEHINGIEQDILNYSIMTIKILLNNGADPNIPFPEDKIYKTEQHFLIKATQLSARPRFPLHIIELLFEYGLDDQARDPKGNPTLMRLIALLHVWKEIPEYRKGFIQIVVNHTTDFNAQNKNGDMVLHSTSQFHDLDTAHLMLQNPVQLDIRNNQKQTPKQVAKLMAGIFPPDTLNLRWYWHFSFFNTNYRMIKLLEETEQTLQLANETIQNGEQIQNSTKDKKSKNPLIAPCRRVFSSIKK